MAKKSKTKAKLASQMSKTTKSPRSSCEESCACDRKGQGMSINTIIIAVLGLIVLVVLIVIFTGQTGKFTKETAATSSVGCPGRWLDTCDTANPDPFYGVTDAAQLRSNAGKTCCVVKSTTPASTTPAK